MASSIFPTTNTTSVSTATTGALSGDGSTGNKLAVAVDGVTVTVNGSNQLESSPIERLSNPTNFTASGGAGGSLAAGTYRSKVAAVDLLGNQTAVSNQQSTTIAAPDDGTGNIFVGWDAVTGALLYRVWVSDDAGSTWVSFDTTSNDYDVTDLAEGVAGTPPSANTTNQPSALGAPVVVSAAFSGRFQPIDLTNNTIDIPPLFSALDNDGNDPTGGGIMLARGGGNYSQIGLLSVQGTLDAPEDSGDGDILGNMLWAGYVSGDSLKVARIQSEAVVSAGNLGGLLKFITREPGGSANSVRLTINADGTAVFTSSVTATDFRSDEVAFASLPATPTVGTLANVSDSNTATWGANVAGSGSNHILARWNGANWTVVGK